MNKIFLREFFKNKRTYLIFILFFLILLTLYTFNYRQPDLFLSHKYDEYMAIKTDLESNRINIQIANQIGQGTDKDAFYLENIDKQLGSLNEMIQRMQEEDYYLADLEESFYIDRQAMINVRQEYVSQDFPEEIEKAKYMQVNHIPYVEENVPSDNAIFYQQLAKFIFNPMMVFLFVMIFILPMFKDIDHQQLDWFASLPKRNNQFVIKYFYHLSLATTLFILLFALAMIPLFIGYNRFTLNYPAIVSIGEHFRAIPMWQWLLLRIGLFVVSVFFVYLFILMVIRWLKSIEVAFITVSILLMGLTFWAYMEPDTSINPINGLIHSQELFGSWLYLWQLLSQFIILCVLIRYIHRSNYLYDSLNGLMNRNQLDNNHPLLNKLLSPLPYWLKFEWQKIYKNKANHRLMMIIGLLMLMAYGVITYQTLEGRSFMIQELQKSARQHDLDLLFFQEFEERQLNQLEYAYQDDYQDNQEMPFKEWLSEHDPQTYEALVRNAQSSAEKLGLTQRLLDKLESDDFTTQDLTGYEIALGEAILTYNNPYYSGYYSPDIISFYDQSINYEAAKEVNRRGVMDYFKVETLSLPYYNSELQEGMTQVLPIDNSFLYTAYLFIQWYMPLLVFVLIVLLAPVFSDLYDQGRQMSWYKTLPLQSRDLYWFKLGANLLNAIALILLVTLMFLAVTFLFGGWGEGNYPIRIFDVAEVGSQAGYPGIRSGDPILYFRFIDLSTYLVKGIALIGAFTIFITMLMHAIGTLLTSRWGTVIVVLLTISGGMYFSLTNIDATWPTYLPFIYLDLRGILDGWYQALTNNASYSFGQGMIILLVWSLGLFMISYLIFNLKRRVAKWS